MALAALATLQDLASRGISLADCKGDPTTILASVSEAVRDAAGCAILSTESTITIPATDDQWLDLPGGPVTAVGSVNIASDAALVQGTDYVMVGDSLWRQQGWLSPNTTPPYAPAMVTVTLTHGLAMVPEDIVDLVCSFASVALTQADEGDYGLKASIQAEHMGDYSVTWQHGMGNQSGPRDPSPVSIPEGTRMWLRARFNTGVGVVGNRR